MIVQVDVLKPPCCRNQLTKRNLVKPFVPCNAIETLKDLTTHRGEPFYADTPHNPMDDEFDALVQETFNSLMECRPDLATFLGLHQYDKKMPSATREAHLQLITDVSDYLEKFQSISEDDLSQNRQFERKLMISTLKFHLFQEGTIRRWEKDPNVAEMIGSAIVPLFSREFAPLEERLESITARLTQCPAVIEEFKTRMRTPVPLWVDMAKESCNMLPFFFKIISDAAKEKGLNTTELDEASSRTSDVLSQYIAWLDTLSGEGEPILGKDLFEKLLKVRNLQLTSVEILKIGEYYLEQGKCNLKELVSEIDPSSSVEDVRTRILADYPPTFEDTLEEYEKAIAKMRKVVLEKGFATLPENERLIVTETPSFMRPIIPVAAYAGPAKFEKDQMGIYFVTPVEGDALAEHNYASILNTSVHEGYPGHHLQMSRANQNSSLARVMCRAPELIEGWAHYCEERMRDYGLADINVQVVQTLGIIFRAVRIIIDVNLHCGRMTFDEAVSFLEHEIGKEHYAATAEVKRYTKTPGYPLSYLLGKHLLLQVQEEVKEHMGEKYSDRQFHDAVLQAGSIPFPYLREELKLKGML